MKLATLKDGSRDGMLAVVSRDLKTVSLADGIAPTLQRVLDDWNFFAPQLEELYTALNQGKARRSFDFNPAQCMAPLPRAYQWADGSVYESHVKRMSLAAGNKWEDYSWREPMIYQGGSDDFIGAMDDVVFAEESWGIDFEAEIAVILGDTPMQTKREDALENVRLFTLLNDWSLRNLIAREVAKHFGFFQCKPATAFAPVAITPDELGEAWRDGLPHFNVSISWNGVRYGELNAAEGVKFNFADLIVHAAKTRNLRAGTVLGLGTISNANVENGYATIAEKRAQETIEANAGKVKAQPVSKAAAAKAARAAAKAAKLAEQVEQVEEKAAESEAAAEGESTAEMNAEMQAQAAESGIESGIEQTAEQMTERGAEHITEQAAQPVAAQAEEATQAPEAAEPQEEQPARDLQLTEFMKFGERVRIEAKDAAGHNLFGTIDQQVISLRRRRAALAAEARVAAEAKAAADATTPDDGETVAAEQ